MRKKTVTRHRDRLFDGEAWFTVLVEGQNGDDAFVQVFFTPAGEIGQAIARVTAAAREEEGIADPVASEADAYDPDAMPGDAVELGDSRVFTTGGRFCFPADEAVFRIPRGVILSCIEGEFDPEELRPGFRRREEGDLFRLECAVPEGDVEETFVALTCVLPDIRVSWIECSHEWEDAGVTQFYTDEDLNTPELVEGFLRRERENVVANGMVKFTVYSTEGHTNLLLDDHKEICVITHSREVRDTVAAALLEMGFEEPEDYRTLSRGLHHWHYVPAEALPRDAFVEHLLDNGFAFWKEISDET